ncbi:MAG: D-alanyl-D-alanine carboxypeptidase, partial [Notoacmeibacter sp.]|nr:D-alanyl-D-alanine carboxypeptidase [Notoacmeibacter sp.]
MRYAQAVQSSAIRKFFLATMAAAMALALAVPAQAKGKYAGIVVDANTGRTLYESSADSLRYPASLTKMMTLYILFEGLSSGKLKKSTRIPVSAYAAARPPSKLGLKPGQTVTVETAIYALVTKSANDVASAVGEYLGGSEAGFGRIMTAKARSLGMSRTTFRNPHG